MMISLEKNERRVEGEIEQNLNISLLLPHHNSFGKKTVRDV